MCEIGPQKHVFLPLAAVLSDLTNAIITHTQYTTENSGKTAVTLDLLCRLRRWRHRRGWAGGRETRRCGSMRREAQKEEVEAIQKKGHERDESERR